MPPPADLRSAYRYCRQVSRRSGSSFYLAFRGLPREMFRDMCVLYAFMRHTDDLGDAPGRPREQRHQELNAWSRQLQDAFESGRDDDPILRALADLAARRNIPQQWPQGVIAGVRSDLTPRRFETFAELEDYCYHVAGLVGLCCLRIWDYRGEAECPEALACGTAFQLTNILRDLGEDAREGRVYLPREDLQRFGYSEAELKAGIQNEPFRALMRFETTRAREHFQRALPLLDHLPREGERLLAAFFDMYGALLRDIERANFDVFSRRIGLSRWKKLSVTLRCLFGWNGASTARAAVCPGPHTPPER